MKKIISLLVLVFVMLVLFGQVAMADLASSQAAYNAGNYTEAIPFLKAAILVAKTSNPDMVMSLQHMLVKSYAQLKDKANVAKEYAVLIALPLSSAQNEANFSLYLSDATIWKAWIVGGTDKVLTLSILQTVIDMDACLSSEKAYAQYLIGTVLDGEKKSAEAQIAYVNACLNYADAKDIAGLVLAFNKIKPSKIGKDKYVQVLDVLLLGIKVVDNAGKPIPVNIEFKGTLLSEQLGLQGK